MNDDGWERVEGAIQDIVYIVGDTGVVMRNSDIADKVVRSLPPDVSIGTDVIELAADFRCKACGSRRSIIQSECKRLVVTTKKAQPKQAPKVAVSKARVTTRVAGPRTGVKKTAPSRKSAGPRPVAFGAPVLGIVAPAMFLKGKRGKAPSKTEVSEAAKVLRAYKELVRLAELRLIHQARRSKTSQDAIAALLGTSQPTVSRIAKQIEQTPSVLEPSPSEIINQRAVRQIDDETMMNMLLSYAYTPGRHDPTGGAGFVRGDWRQIENALIAGLITDEEFERIAREAPSALSGSPLPVVRLDRAR